MNTHKKFNHPPVIFSLTANPSSIDTNQTTTITCTSSDPDGDSLTYAWTKTGGTFEGNTSDPDVTWTAPSTPGNYTINCEVSDGKEEDRKSVNILVNNPTVNNQPPYIAGSPSPTDGSSGISIKKGFKLDRRRP